jgi:hypothetical protein
MRSPFQVGGADEEFNPPSFAIVRLVSILQNPSDLIAAKEGYPASRTECGMTPSVDGRARRQAEELTAKENACPYMPGRRF